MATNWVDFRAVKNAVTMRMALDHYGVNWLRKRGDELAGRCPIHKGEGTDTFHVNLAKNAFHCFSCKAKGNVLDFVAAMEQGTARDAAVKLADWFSITDNGKQPPQQKAVPMESRGEERAENKPLTFQLKGIDSAHPYLGSRGITKETAERFGIGYFAGKGSMSGRIVIPIHNPKGQLVAYAGRAIDDDIEPKYKFPAGFRKGLELFNLHRLFTHVKTDQAVVIVEGFFDCIKVHEAGYSCVALMGSSLSNEQEALVCSLFTRSILLLDGDEPGKAATNFLLARLGHKQWVRAIQLADASQPDSLSFEEIRHLLAE